MIKWRGEERNDHLHAVAHVVQHAVVDGLADVAHRPLGIGWGDDLVCAGRVLVGGEDADLPPGHLLFVDVHRLKKRGRREGVSSTSRTFLLNLNTILNTACSLNPKSLPFFYYEGETFLTISFKFCLMLRKLIILIQRSCTLSQVKLQRAFSSISRNFHPW